MFAFYSCYCRTNIAIACTECLRSPMQQIHYRPQHIKYDFYIAVKRLLHLLHHEFILPEKNSLRLT